MFAKPELFNDPSCPQLTHNHMSSPGKHALLFNSFYPTTSVQFGRTQQAVALFTFISNLLMLLTDSCIQGQSRGQRISHRSAEVVQTFQKLSRNIWRAGEPSVSIPCLFHTGTLCVGTVPDARKQQWHLLYTSRTFNQAVTNSDTTSPQAGNTHTRFGQCKKRQNQ